MLVGKHGNGDARIRSLGSNCAKVHAEINRRLYTKPTKSMLTQSLMKCLIINVGMVRIYLTRYAMHRYDSNVIKREVNKRF